MSSDTTSESTLDDSLSDMSAGQRTPFVAVVGQRPRENNCKDQKHLLQKLFTREVSLLNLQMRRLHHFPAYLTTLNILLVKLLFRN